MNVTTVWCEWDIGISDAVFLNEEVARQHAVLALESCGVEETVEELEEEGLIAFETKEVVTE